VRASLRAPSAGNEAQSRSPQAGKGLDPKVETGLPRRSGAGKNKSANRCGLKRLALSIVRLIVILFENLSPPDQVRGGLFRDHARSKPPIRPAAIALY